MHLFNRQLVDKKPYNVRVDQMSVGQNDFLPNDVEPKWHLEVVDGVVNLPTDLLPDDDVRYRRQQVGQTLQQKYHFFYKFPNWRHDIQHNNEKRDTQHNDSVDKQSVIVLSVANKPIMLSAIFFSKNKT